MTPHDCLSRARAQLQLFGERVVRSRCEHGVTVRELAEQTGIRADTLARIENALWMPSAEHARILTQWLLQHPVSDDHGSRHEGSCRDHQRSGGRRRQTAG